MCQNLHRASPKKSSTCWRTEPLANSQLETETFQQHEWAWKQIFQPQLGLRFLQPQTTVCLHFLRDPEPRSRVGDKVLVLWLGVRPVPLRWESWVQDIGPPEISQLHVISNSESSPRDLQLNAKTQLLSTTSKLQCWTPYAKQLARQEHNTTH